MIVGVEGRPAGRDAIALARLLVTPDGRLTLAHVHAGEPAGAAAGRPAFKRDARAAAQRLLGQERETAAVDADLVAIAAPSAGRGLHHVAASEGAELLVVGSCSRGFAGRVLIGNDTRAALNGAPCAVAVAPLGYTHDLRGLRTIGVGYDGSPESESALALARALGERHGARLRAVQVVQIPASPWAAFAGVAWGAALEDLVSAARAQLDGLAGVDAEAVLGVAGEELAAFGEHVDLLIVGSRGYGPVRRLMFGSSSDHLAGHARCPLLVLPRGATGVDAGITPGNGTDGAEPSADWPSDQ